MEEYNDDEELERQRHLNDVYSNDKVIKFRLIDFAKNLEAKFDKATCIKKTQKHKLFYTNYCKKMKIFQKDNNVF